MSELETIFYEQKIIKTRSGDFKVGPFNIGQISKIKGQAIELIKFIINNQKQLKPEDYITLIIQHTDEIVDLVSISTSSDKEKICSLLPDDLLNIIATIVEENTDFFMKSLLPEITKILSQQKQVLGNK